MIRYHQTVHAMLGPHYTALYTTMSVRSVDMVGRQNDNRQCRPTELHV